MRLLIAVGLLGMAIVPLFGEDAWELVYPEAYRPLLNVEMLSIGESPDEVLVGCRNGTVLRAVKYPDGSLSDWEKST